MTGEHARPRTPAALLLVGILLLVVDAREVAPPATSAAREAGALVLHPVSAGVTAIADPLVDLNRNLAAAPGARERIEELERKNAELSELLLAHERRAARLEQFEGVLELPGTADHEIVPARAITRTSPRERASAVTLDVGSRDGVAADMAVVHPGGLVGRVTSVTRWSATVLLITDTDSAVGARLADSGEIGVVAGDGTGAAGNSAAAPLRLELLDPSADVEPGDQVVTLGSYEDVPFVPDVPLGTVEHVAEISGEPGRTARLRPAAALDRLDAVGVVVAGAERDPRDPLSAQE